MTWILSLSAMAILGGCDDATDLQLSELTADEATELAVTTLFSTLNSTSALPERPEQSADESGWGLDFEAEVRCPGGGSVVMAAWMAVVWLIPAAACRALFRGFSSTSLLVLVRRVQPAQRVLLDLAGQIAGLVLMVGLALYVTQSAWVLVAGALERRRRTDLEPRVLLLGHERRNGLVAELGVSVLQDSAQVFHWNAVGYERRDDPLRQVGVREPAHRGNFFRAESRQFARYVQAAIAGQAGQQDFLEIERGGLAPGTDIFHSL